MMKLHCQGTHWAVFVLLFFLSFKKKTGYLGTPTAKLLWNVKITFTSKHAQFGF